MGQCRMERRAFSGAFSKHPRELEIRLKSGYFKGCSVIHKCFHFHLIHSRESRGFRRSGRIKGDFNFEHANNNNSSSGFSVNSKRRGFSQGWKRKKTARNEECYSFNGKYWRKIVFMFIVVQKKRFFFASFSKSVFHSSFFSFPPKLLFIIISPCFFSSFRFCLSLRNGF